MRVGFAGTPAFAATILDAVQAAGFDVPIVLTQPDRPRGRGQRPDTSPVKRLALLRGIAVQAPATLRDPAARVELGGVPLDVLVVAAYGLLLPREVLAWPRHGCLNVHASLLPRWRGAAPVQRALLAGDAETGITIMQMDEGLDTGPMIESANLAIGPGDTAGTLTEKLASLGAAAIVRALRRLAADGKLASTAQPAAGATHAPKFGRNDAAIAWSSDAPAIDRQVRAFNPAPGAWTILRGETVKVWAGAPSAGNASSAPGTVQTAASDGIAVACGAGTYTIHELQAASGRRMSAAAFVAGHRQLVGAVLGGAPAGIAVPKS
jgi:methionyl-tRNA formyltransferase